LQDNTTFLSPAPLSTALVLPGRRILLVTGQCAGVFELETNVGSRITRMLACTVGRWTCTRLQRLAPVHSPTTTHSLSKHSEKWKETYGCRWWLPKVSEL